MAFLESGLTKKLCCCKDTDNQTYDTCTQASPEIDLERKKRVLGGNRTHNFHNLSVTALPVELPSPWNQGSGEGLIVMLHMYSNIQCNMTSNKEDYIVNTVDYPC